jgi:hypothetical protein
MEIGPESKPDYTGVNGYSGGPFCMWCWIFGDNYDLPDFLQEVPFPKQAEYFVVMHKAIK